MHYSLYGVALTDRLKPRGGRPHHHIAGVPPPAVWPRPTDFDSNSDQQNRMSKKLRDRRGVDLRLSKSPLGKQDGFGPFAGSMLVGIPALMIGKMLGFGQGGRGLQFSGTRRGRGKNNRGILWTLPTLVK